MGSAAAYVIKTSALKTLEEQIPVSHQSNFIFFKLFFQTGFTGLRGYFSPFPAVSASGVAVPASGVDERAKRNNP